MKIIIDESRPECGEIHFNEEDPKFKQMMPKVSKELIVDVLKVQKRYLEPIKK